MCRNFSPPLTKPHRHTHTARPPVLFVCLCSNKCLFLNLQMKLETLISNSKIADSLQMIPVESLRSLPYFHMQKVILEWSNDLNMVLETLK